MAPDNPVEALIDAARAALAHIQPPAASPQGSDAEQQREPSHRLHAAVSSVVQGLHKPLKSVARCFGKHGLAGDEAPPGEHDACTASGGKKLPFWDVRGIGSDAPQLELLLCIAFDSLTHTFQMLDAACKQKGAKFDYANLQFDQLDVFKKVIDGNKANFDGFLSNLGFARVGAPPANMVGASPASAPAAVHEEGGESVAGGREGVESGSGGPQSRQKLASGLLNIPLSNVERLRSTLSAVSLTELIEFVPQLVGRSLTSADGHPDKKKLFSVQDFFRYTQAEGGDRRRAGGHSDEEDKNHGGPVGAGVRRGVRLPPHRPRAGAPAGGGAGVRHDGAVGFRRPDVPAGAGAQAGHPRRAAARSEGEQISCC